jgi:uncharacterized protein (DUF1501 family)
MNRRDVLKFSALAALGAQSTISGRLFAAPATTNKLLFVFMRGGYDAATLLPPIGSKFYYDSRPNIAVPKPGTDANTAIELNADWGLHPVMRETIYPLYQMGQAAFIPFAGIDDLSRSHFETQDSIELGQPLGGSRNFQSGFLNRLVQTLGGKGAIAFTDQLPVILQGSMQVPNMALKTVGKPSVDPRQSALIAQMYKGTPLEKRVEQGFSTRDEVMKELAMEMDAASRNAISAKGFELEARRIAKLMREKHNIGFVDVGGWDTHVAQGGATGYLASRLDELARGLNGFQQEMGADWKNTVVVVVSEFGRTFRENGNRGTDHGHGSVYWILGGSINGGKVLGEQVAVEQKTLFQNRDYPVLNEYRSVLGGLFQRMYGLSDADVTSVFAGTKAKDIGLV